MTDTTQNERVWRQPAKTVPNGTTSLEEELLTKTQQNESVFTNTRNGLNQHNLKINTNETPSNSTKPPEIKQAQTMDPSVDKSALDQTNLSQYRKMSVKLSPRISLVHQSQLISDPKPHQLEKLTLEQSIEYFKIYK